MQLLLERPTLAESVEHVELLAQAGAHGIEVLIEAIDYFHARPDARAAQLVEAWKDTPKGRGVARLLSQDRSEEHTSELQSLMRISYAVFCLKKKNKQRQ